MKIYGTKFMKMGVQFRGGELVQKGKGIGGFFRGLASIFKPLVKSVGKTVIKAAKSETGRDIASALASQAIDSSLNMGRDLIAGNDLKKSFHSEGDNFKKTGKDILNMIQKRADSKKPKIQPKKRRIKRKHVTLQSMNRYERGARPY